jgi:hypothetical protein
METYGMDIGQALDGLAEWLKQRYEVESVGRITGENAIGVELRDGTEYFITIERA